MALDQVEAVVADMVGGHFGDQLRLGDVAAIDQVGKQRID